MTWEQALAAAEAEAAAQYAADGTVLTSRDVEEIATEIYAKADVHESPW